MNSQIDQTARINANRALTPEARRAESEAAERMALRGASAPSAPRITAEQAMSKARGEADARRAYVEARNAGISESYARQAAQDARTAESIRQIAREQARKASSK